MSTEIQEIMAKIDSLTAGLAELRERVAALAGGADATVEEPAEIPAAAEVTVEVAAEEPADTPEENGVPRRQWAFTLNDRYRFRRELFGNSDAEMVDTLELLAAMTSADEVEEYLFEDLGWDPANDDVADFVAIVRRRFASHPSNLL